MTRYTIDVNFVDWEESKHKRNHGQFSATSGSASKPAPTGSVGKAAAATIKPKEGTRLDISKMKQVGGQLGSNPGGQYQDLRDGKKYYAKASKSDDHAKNEVLASKLYDLAGSPVLPASLVDTGKGKLGTATEWRNNVQLINRKDKNHLKEAQKNFATHAWLANWDAVGLEFDNQGLVNGKMTTLDPGGSLLYRAEGKPKGAAFGDKVGEWDTLRDPSKPNAHAIFGSMNSDDLAASAKKVTDIPDSAIRQIVNEHGPGDSGARAALAERLIARKSDIGARARAASG